MQGSGRQASNCDVEQSASSNDKEVVPVMPFANRSPSNNGNPACGCATGALLSLNRNYVDIMFMRIHTYVYIFCHAYIVPFIQRSTNAMHNNGYKQSLKRAAETTLMVSLLPGFNISFGNGWSLLRSLDSSFLKADYTPSSKRLPIFKLKFKVYQGLA